MFIIASHGEALVKHQEFSCFRRMSFEGEENWGGSTKPQSSPRPSPFPTSHSLPKAHSGLWTHSPTLSVQTPWLLQLAGRKPALEATGS